MFGIDLSLLNDLGPEALLVLIVLLILSGFLLPRWTVTQIKKERDEWKNTAIQAQETANKTITTLAQYTQVYGKTTTRVLNSLPSAEGIDEDTVPTHNTEEIK